MNWIRRDERMPDHTHPVLAIMDAGPVSNPDHPGYATGRWQVITRALENTDGTRSCLFATEVLETGCVTHWMELPAMPARDETAAK